MTAGSTDFAQNSVFERVARAGYVVSGLLCVIIAYLAIRYRSTRRRRDRRSIRGVGSVGSQTGGVVALWCAVFALLAVALWRLAETARGRSTDPKSQRTTSEILDRAKALALAVVYFGFSSSTLGFARGAGKSTGRHNAGLSAQLRHTGAPVLIVGSIIVAVGGYHVYKSTSRNFLNDIQGTPTNVVLRLGVVGFIGCIAKGLVLAAAGDLVITAATLSKPGKATTNHGSSVLVAPKPEPFVTRRPVTPCSTRRGMPFSGFIPRSLHNNFRATPAVYRPLRNRMGWARRAGVRRRLRLQQQWPLHRPCSRFGAGHQHQCDLYPRISGEHHQLVPTGIIGAPIVW